MSVKQEQSRQHGNGALSQQQFTTTLRDVNRVETLTQQRGNRPLFYTESDGRFDEAARNDLQDDSELQNSTAKDQRSRSANMKKQCERITKYL
ncbi:hypothetical protein NECAME_12172 [Necator americanus]|uniref:Uncharacterized protein n=1 Tax=Necator americanus TaxID=51031 RepID=W2T444_NECAM|nr:hypothetical protein NECAME_12172 [Necator americanus]ETN75742.1 hypothetical protein NECAME_12172 [Necator americanus]